jgi:Kef-type K+ transport system membrane component KefB
MSEDEHAIIHRPQRHRLRELLTYGAFILLGGLVLLLVLPAGDRITAAPQGPATSTVRGAAASCLGNSLALTQSGVFVNFAAPSAASSSSPGQPGAAVADGKVSRLTGTGQLQGSCATGTALAGQHFVWDVTFARAKSAAGKTINGTVAVGDTRLAADLVPVVAAAKSAGPPVDPNSVTETFLALGVVIVATRLMGSLFKRLAQPPVAGEIIAGVLLGPSLLGLWFPSIVHGLFKPAVTDSLNLLAQLGLILFMFLIGLELDHKLLKGAGHTAVIISHASIVVPFSCGAALALFLYPLIGSGPFAGFALFMGAAMAITAFPVLSRILADTGLTRTKLGAIAIACAAVDDVSAWCVLAVVVAVVRSSGAATVVRTVLFTLLFVAVMFTAVRWLLGRLLDRGRLADRLDGPLLAGILVFVLLSAWLTDRIGVHAIFGAFVAGAVMPRSSGVVAGIRDRLESMTLVLLLPVFFAVVGLSTRFGLINKPELWLIGIAVIAVAMVGKWAGSGLAARSAGNSWRFSMGLGALMNARGLTELVILSVGRSLGVISPDLFTIMVFMALFTTLLANPALRLLGLVRAETTRAWSGRTGLDRDVTTAVIEPEPEPVGSGV